MGMQLGAEGVFHNNVSRWTAIAGTVKRIVVYACSAAATRPDNRGTTADGKYLMGALAIHTGAFVYAADQNQSYDTIGKHGRFYMRDWEGQVWEFPPSGAGPKQTTLVPSIDGVFDGR